MRLWMCGRARRPGCECACGMWMWMWMCTQPALGRGNPECSSCGSRGSRGDSVSFVLRTCHADLHTQFGLGRSRVQARGCGCVLISSCPRSRGRELAGTQHQPLLWAGRAQSLTPAPGGSLSPREGRGERQDARHSLRLHCALGHPEHHPEEEPEPQVSDGLRVQGKPAPLLRLSPLPPGRPPGSLQDSAWGSVTFQREVDQLGTEPVGPEEP